MPSPLARLINTSAALASGVAPDLTAGGGLIGTVGPGTTTLPGAVSPGSVAESLLPFLHGQGALRSLFLSPASALLFLHQALLGNEESEHGEKPTFVFNYI